MKNIDDPLIRALQANDASEVARLLDAGRSIGERFHFGRTLLHVAAEAGSGECACVLLERGATLEARDEAGSTALIYALGAGLLLAKANPNQQDVDGFVAMGRVSSDEMLDLLLAHGADPNIGDQCDFKPSYWVKDPKLKARLLSLEHPKHEGWPPNA